MSAADIRDIHELIVESNAETTAGVSSSGDLEYAVEHIQEGHFGQVPESLHEKAFQLLRLIAANHPFVDGNKRTALMSTRIFYALNGRRFDYDREIKEILKALATDESSVNEDDVIDYLRAHTEPLAPEYEATINCGCHASKAQISYLEIPSTTQATMNDTNRTIMTTNPIVRCKYGRRK